MGPDSIDAFFLNVLAILFRQFESRPEFKFFQGRGHGLLDLSGKSLPTLKRPTQTNIGIHQTFFDKWSYEDIAKAHHISRDAAKK